MLKLVPERYMAKLFTLVKSKYGFVVEFDESGKIVNSYQDPAGAVIPDASQVDLIGLRHSTHTMHIIYYPPFTLPSVGFG